MVEAEVQATHQEGNLQRVSQHLHLEAEVLVTHQEGTVQRGIK